MPSSRKIRHITLVRWGLLLLLLVLTSVLTWSTMVGVLPSYALYIGVGLIFITLVLLAMLERMLAGWLRAVVAQCAYLEGSAFDSLYERSPVAYLTIDRDGQIVESNPAAVKLLEGETDAIAGVDFLERLRLDDASEAAVLAGKIEAGLTVNDTEVPLETLAGNGIWVMLTVFDHRSDGQRLVSLVDVTEQKQVDTAKSEFVALATHQLRTPIAAVRWNVELLEKTLKETKTEPQVRYLNKVNRNIGRMLDLINDFLSVSKLEMGTYACQSELVNLTDFMTSIVDEFAEKISSKQVQVKRTDEPPQLVVKSDPQLLHIIVSNLVSNAVKYLQPKGVLRIAYTLEGETLTIEVADNGIGIPEGEIEQLFTKFYRASNARVHQTEGTGLGLYIVRQSAEQLGGTVTVSAAEKEGARFVVTMPVMVVSEREIG